MNETIFVFDMKSQGCKIYMKSLLVNDFRSFVSNNCQNESQLKYDFQNIKHDVVPEIVIRANLYVLLSNVFHVMLDNKSYK